MMGALPEIARIQRKVRGSSGRKKGSEKILNADENQHPVTLSRGFQIARYPVTQAQFEKVMGFNPSHFHTSGPEAPVEMVSWDDAVEFCKKLGKGYRLPTEAEWEYACRSGSENAYCFGEDKARLKNYGWYSGNSEGRTHPVGQKKPNVWGIHDMHGNVLEWCEDWYQLDLGSVEVIDPTGSGMGDHRVLRGGCWLDEPRDCRSASRNKDEPSHRENYTGFRPLRYQQPA